MTSDKLLSVVFSTIITIGHNKPAGDDQPKAPDKKASTSQEGQGPSQPSGQQPVQQPAQAQGRQQAEQPAYRQQSAWQAPQGQQPQQPAPQQPQERPQQQFQSRPERSQPQQQEGEFYGAQGGRGGGGGGRGRGEGGRGRGEGGRGRGEGGRGRGEGGRGRGEDGRGRGGGRGRGDSGMGRGDGGMVRGDGGMVRVEAGRGQEDYGSGRGDEGRGPWGAGRGQAEGAGRGPDDYGSGRGDEARGPAGAGRGQAEGGGGRGRGEGGERGRGGRGRGQGRGQQPGYDSRQSTPRSESVPGSITPSSSSSSISRGMEEVASGVQQMSMQPGVSQQSPRPITAGGDAPSQILPQTAIARKPGTECKQRTTLITNFFPLNLGKLGQAIHYDVAINPDKPKKWFRNIMEVFRQKHFKNRWPAYDGNKNLYSSSPLFNSAELSDNVNIQDDEDRAKEYNVTIKFATYVDLTCLQNYAINMRGRNILDMDKPMQALQCIDIVLRSSASMSCIPVGRSHFTRPDHQFKLGDGCVLYHGFYQAAILGWKPFVNVDVAHKAFPSALNMIELVGEMFECRVEPNMRLRDNEFKALNRHMKQLKVEYKIAGMQSTRRVYRVNELAAPPRDAQFKDDKGTMMTVEEYFKRTKNVALKYPCLPTVWVGARTRANKILLPIEFCTILPDQVVNKKMTENQTRKMIRQAATDTSTRRQNIERSVQRAGFDRSLSMREFGISVDTRPQEVEGRILHPPVLQYSRQQQQVSRGVWRGSQFLLGVELKNWSILCLDGRTRDDGIRKLEQELVRAAGSSGMNIANPQPFTRLDDRNLSRALQDYFRRNKHEMVIVILNNSPTCYNYVKQASEIAVGCLTQCLKSNTVYKLNPTTVSNILLKINAKLNGTNHSLPSLRGFFQRPCMIMGADVTHPGPENKDFPSVAAVTASIDIHFFRYSFEWRLQPSRQEMIEDLEAITREHLLNFYRRNNKMKPERIIYVRDGVSDGQFIQVLNVELMAIRSACQKLEANYKPSIVFVVVQKRHHTRFFPKDSRISEDKNVNVPAGTCVDTEITHPSMVDFYLVSHASIQGVAKPTKYVKLWDDCNMSEDELEKLMYYLCHLFARCNRSVSYPAPTYYAHLAAARARVYCEIDRIDMNNLRKEQGRLTIKENISKEMPMFFV